MKSRWFFFALGVLFAVPASAAGENPPAVANPPIVSQKSIGPNACGPCALLNALQAGGEPERVAASGIRGGGDVERVKTIIETYGSVTSDAYPDRLRFRDNEGMCDREMLGMVRDFLARSGLGEVEGKYLDRTKEEPSSTHLREVHAQLRGSLASGFPPIVFIRSFAAKQAPKQPESEATYSWKGLNGHWVSVLSLPDALPAGALSFTMRVADSWSGREQECFVHEEQYRNFKAAKGDTRNSTWSTVRCPFLVVTAPGLPLGTNNVPWYLRTNIVLSYGIVRHQRALVPAPL